MAKAVCIVSGGLDSTVAYYQAKKAGHDVIPINFHYGSKHNNQERIAARAIIGSKLLEIDLDFTMMQSNLLKSGGEIPEGHYEDQSMRSTVVPFRNGIFLSYAIGIAESHQCDIVIYGAHMGDHVIYPDCRKSFIGAMKKAAIEGTYNQIIIFAPFAGVSKADIVTIGSQLGVPFAKTYSCYKGGVNHCGKCGTV